MSAPMPKPPPGTALSRCDKKLSMIVNGYSKFKNMATGRYLKSVAVAAGGHTWRVALYPSGRLAGTTESVSVYLLDDAAAGADTDADDVHVEATFTLHEVGCLAPRLVSPKVAGAIGGRRWDTFIGCELFVSREDLENLDFVVKHDRFTIWCEFTVFPNTGKPTAVATATLPAVRVLRSSTSGGLPADLDRLLETKKGADLTFEVGGKVFAAHKLVLAARSPVFMADFFGPPPAKEEKDTTGYIRICDMHPDSFQALLRYIYTDALALPETTTATNATGGAAVAALAGDLLAAADRYGLEHLKSLIEKELCRRDVIGVGTALPMLALAERHRCRELKRRCLEFIASGRNTRAFMATDGGVEHLARSCPSVVKEVIAKVMDAREATPRNPLVVSVDASLYFYALILIVPFVVLWLCFVIASS